jgi:hypothetical protein
VSLHLSLKFEESCFRREVQAKTIFFGF